MPNNNFTQDRMTTPNLVNLEQERSSKSLSPDSVLVKALFTVVVAQPFDVCSLVGHVVAIGATVKNLVVGDVVIALASREPLLTLPADDCIKVTNPTEVTADMAFWAFAVSCIPLIHLSGLEIGEDVLIFSNNLIGQMLMDLAWSAGAGTCTGVDPSYSDAVDLESRTEPFHGPMRVNRLSALDTLIPNHSFDLLIDAVGDAAQLDVSLPKVRSHSRMVTTGYYHPSRFDLNLYPDLHKRSLRLINYRLPTSLGQLGQNDGCGSLPLDQTLDYVRYLFETGGLSSSNWSITNVKLPEQNKFDQALQMAERNALLIDWGNQAAVSR